MKASFAGGILGRSSKINDGMRSAVELLREKAMGIKQIAN
jgi:hypothetical protein